MEPASSIQKKNYAMLIAYYDSVLMSINDVSILWRKINEGPKLSNEDLAIFTEAMDKCVNIICDDFLEKGKVMDSIAPETKGTEESLEYIHSNFCDQIRKAFKSKNREGIYTLFTSLILLIESLAVVKDSIKPTDIPKQELN